MDEVKAKVKKPIYKRVWFWIIVVVLGLYAIGSSAGGKDNTNLTNSNATTTTTQTSGQPAATKVPQPTEEPSAWINAGMYKVGQDIAAGEYLLQSDGGITPYYQVTKDSTGSMDSIIANDNFTSDRYVTVQTGQYLEFRDSNMIPIDKAPVLQPTGGRYQEGMYKVGRDIQSGEYKVVPDGSGMSYIEVCADSSGNMNSIVTNDLLDAEKYTTISNGQYIKLLGCYIQTK